MLVIDTNVLIYAADRGSEYHKPCRTFLEERVADSSSTCLTWNICYEFLRVTTHPKVFVTPWSTVSAQKFIQNLLDAGCSVLTHTDRHARLLRETLAEFSDLRGNLVHDLHTAVVMREHGISRICTRDTDFQRFPFLTVIDPLRS